MFRAPAFLQTEPNIATIPPGAPTRNLLLRSLSAEDRALLDPHLRTIRLHRRMALASAGGHLAQAYFLEDGIASVVARGRDGAEIEVGLIGYEGVAPVAAVLGADSSPHEIYVQVGEPEARVILVSALRDLMRAHQSLREALQRYAMAFLAQSADTILSYGNRAVEQRLARWLLMCHDRLPGDTFELTHEFIAVMLAIRRATVTVALHRLESLGAIRGMRGLITVLDRELLTELAGDCYGRAEAEYRKLVGPFPAD